MNGAIALLIPEQSGHNQRFVPQTKREAHDLITKLCEAVSAANAHDEVREGTVPTPKPPRKRTAAKKGQSRGK